MAEASDLDRRLARARADVLDSITAPPLGDVRRRAAVRRRTRLAATGAAMLAVLVGGSYAVSPLLAPRPSTQTGSDTDPGQVYGANGITMVGLRAEAMDLTGTVSDVAFTDARHGYALNSCPSGGGCRPLLARTTDGGATWSSTQLPAGVDARELVAFPGGEVLVRGAAVALLADDAAGWRQVPVTADRPAVATVAAGQLLRRSDLDEGCAEELQVFDARRGPAGPLVTGPGFPVCWVADAPTPDGAWWVGGRRGEQPMVAVSRDGGRNWRSTPLALPGGGGTSAEVAVLGRHVWVTVRGIADAPAYGGSRAATRAIYHSADGGNTFTASRRTGRTDRLPEPWLVAGAVVPLLDGRLLVAGEQNRWYVSADDGATFQRAEGTLPAVGALARTGAGYLAYGLFNAGWTAFSTDGGNWRKLPIR